MAARTRFDARRGGTRARDASAAVTRGGERRAAMKLDSIFTFPRLPLLTTYRADSRMLAPVPLPVRFKLPPRLPLAPTKTRPAPRLRSRPVLHPQALVRRALPRASRASAPSQPPPPSMAPLTDDALPRRKRSARYSASSASRGRGEGKTVGSARRSSRRARSIGFVRSEAERSERGREGRTT